MALAEVPEEGLHIALDADFDVRDTLARSANLREVTRLEASFDLRRRGPDILQIEGEVIASVGQNCVVTLDPIEQNLHELVDITFSPTAAGTLADGAGEATFGMTESERPNRWSGAMLKDAHGEGPFRAARIASMLLLTTEMMSAASVGPIFSHPRRRMTAARAMRK